MGGFNKKTIRDIDLKDKRVLLRADYNVPLDEHGNIADDYRITQSIPTLHYLLQQNCKVIVVSHLGRPEPGGDNAKYSLAPVARRLKELLHGEDVEFVGGSIGPDVKKAINKRHKGSVTLLENVRFEKGEVSNDSQYAKELASYADVFVQDCFGVAHREHASIVGVAKLLPSVSGLLIEKEVTIITSAMENPDRPLMAIIGGAKISDKIELIQRFMDITDYMAVGGAMANTFLAAAGAKVGKSLYEKSELHLAKQILDEAAKKEASSRFKFYVPEDVVVCRNMDGSTPTRIVDISSNTYADIASYPKKPSHESTNVGDDELILDIGPLSAKFIAGMATCAKTVIWNGTMGVTEIKGLSGAANPFGHGSATIANVLSGAQSPYTIVGGGDTASFVESISGLREGLGHVSTGGGASMDLMSGKKLPGVETLQDKG